MHVANTKPKGWFCFSFWIYEWQKKELTEKLASLHVRAHMPKWLSTFGLSLHNLFLGLSNPTFPLSSSATYRRHTTQCFSVAPRIWPSFTKRANLLLFPSPLPLFFLSLTVSISLASPLYSFRVSYARISKGRKLKYGIPEPSNLQDGSGPSVPLLLFKFLDFSSLFKIFTTSPYFISILPLFLKKYCQFGPSIFLPLFFWDVTYFPS